MDTVTYNIENIQTEIIQVLDTEQAWFYHIIPVETTGADITFFIDSNNSLESTKDELELLFGKSVNLIECEHETMQKYLSVYYRKRDRAVNSFSVNINNVASDDILHRIIYEANEIGSSDIHVEPYEKRARIRFRIDGKLVEKYVLQNEEYPSFLNRIKIMANLDIAEKRLPQDGRIFFQEEGVNIDIRVSTLPALHGEKAVLRLLQKDATEIDIKKLGLTPEQQSLYKEGVKKPHGIILISGPTGSGKTTTLYATLKLLNNNETNIMTIEDPIEYTLEGINQVQLKEKIGLTFASALRTFLRQDPDIIMLGEIRDNETAKMAVRAALTGHLVLSTIHTNSAWGTISRLKDMGVPAYLIADTLNLSVAQRLVRVLCPECKEKVEFDPALMPQSVELDNLPEYHYVPKGCPHCFYTGYRGRKAIYEVVRIDNDLSMQIKNEETDPLKIYKEKNIVTLAGSALESFEKGETSLDEIYAVLMNS